MTTDLDAAFGSTAMFEGRVSTSISEEKDAAYALLLQPDGKTVVVGAAGERMALARYLADGSLDESFGKAGIKAASGELAEGRAAALQADGGIVVAGSMHVDGGGRFTVMRFTPEGKADFGFGGAGLIVEHDGSSADTGAYAVAVQPDGRIVVAGTSDGAATIVRYDSEGRRDATFGNVGG